jgi:hypothetical protein
VPNRPNRISLDLLSCRFYRGICPFQFVIVVFWTECGRDKLVFLLFWETHIYDHIYDCSILNLLYVIYMGRISLGQLAWTDDWVSTNEVLHKLQMYGAQNHFYFSKNGLHQLFFFGFTHLFGTSIRLCTPLYVFHQRLDSIGKPISSFKYPLHSIL